MFATESNTPFSVKMKLLKAAAKYWSIEMCPNLNSKFATPIIILLSLIILTNGRWYKPASGLFTLSKNIINELIRPKREDQKKILPLLSIASFQIKINGKNKIIRLAKFEILKKKFKIKVINEILIIPYKPVSKTSNFPFKLIIFLKDNPFNIMIIQDKIFNKIM